jgi:membrane protease YdiL (CAAX protease family)
VNLRPVSRRTLAAALLVPGLGTAAFQNWPDGGTPAQLLYVATKLFTLALPLFFIRWEKPRLPSLRALASGTFLGLAIAAAVFVLLATPFGESVRSAEPMVLSKVTELGVAKHFILFAIVISILHTGLEEYFWRGFVFTGLTKHISTPKAHALAGLGFALHHVAILSQFFPLLTAILLSVAVGIGGVLWSLLYARTKTLFAPWVSHAIVDAALMIIGYGMLT